MPIADHKKCTGCHICEIICSVRHHKTMNPKLAMVKVNSNWPWEDRVTVCRQCKKPKCVEACPVDAIERADGYLRIDQDKCTACLECVKACPFDGVVVSEITGKPVLCDTCQGEYLCVGWCPTKVFSAEGRE